MRAPTGTVTLVFTDVQGSTALWDRVPAAMREGLAMHDAIMRAEIRGCQGYEVKTEGDAFMVAFSDCFGAVRFCLGAQASLLEAEWPKRLLEQSEASIQRAGKDTLFRGFRVRMGVHMGAPDCEPNPITDRMDYFGPVVNRAARVGGAGHGGQILLSQIVQASIEVPLGAQIRDLGEHRLKGLSEPERLFQLTSKALEGRRFDPLKTERPRTTNIAPDATPFVGREKAASRLQSLVPSHSVVTIQGLPGTGKTRLAREFALLNANSGVPTWFCDVSSATSLAEVCTRVARLVEPDLVLDGNPVAHLAAVLSELEAVCLILDGVSESTPDLREILRPWRHSAPKLRCVITSERVLGLDDEAVLLLSSLEKSDAVTLFGLLAGAAGATFSIEEYGQEIGDLVQRLDCLPFAIELAAKKSRLLPPDQLVDKLSSIASGLHSQLESSWSALSYEMQDALSSLSGFEDSFDIAAAQAALDVGDEAVFSRLQELLDCSMLSSDASSGRGARFRLLRSVRSFVLDAQPEPEEATDRRGAHYQGVALRLQEQLLGAQRGRALRSLREEQSNLLQTTRTARLASSLRCEVGLAVVAQLAYHGPVGLRRVVLDTLADLDALPHDQLLRLRLAQLECAREQGDAQWAEEIVALGRSLMAQDDIEDANRALFAAEQGALLRTQGRGSREAYSVLQEAMSLAEKADSDEARCRILDAMAAWHQDRSAYREAARVMEEAVVLAKRAGDLRTEGRLRHNVGTIAQDQGDRFGAQHHYEAALALFERIEDPRLRGIATANLGNLATDRGDLDTASELLDTSWLLVQAVGDLRFQGHVRMYQGVVALLRGRFDASRMRLEQGMELERRSKTYRFEALCRGYLGVLALAQGRVVRGLEQLRECIEQLTKAGDADMNIYFQAIGCDCAARAGQRWQHSGEEVLVLARASSSEWLLSCVSRVLAQQDIAEAENQHVAMAKMLGERLAPLGSN